MQRSLVGRKPSRKVMLVAQVRTIPVSAPNISSVGPWRDLSCARRLFDKLEMRTPRPVEKIG